MIAGVMIEYIYLTQIIHERSRLRHVFCVWDKWISLKQIKALKRLI